MYKFTALRQPTSCAVRKNSKEETGKIKKKSRGKSESKIKKKH